METAKVDIRKLQQLNDCINRTIEALNQVRLSVHAGGSGIGHSAPMGLQQGFGTPFGGYPGSMYGAYGSPFGVNPQAAAAMVPGFANVGALAGYPQGYPNAFAAGAGLGHTQVDPRLGWDWTSDPYTSARIAQTFPFVHWGQSPFAWPNV